MISERQHPSSMAWQIWDLQLVQSVAPPAEKLDVASPLRSNSYTLYVEGGLSETNVLTPGSLFWVTSAIATPRHNHLRTRSEPRSVSDSGSTTKSIISRGPEEAMEQRHLPAAISAAHVDVSLGHNILSKKRKLNQDQLSNVDAVDGNKGESHSVLCTDEVNIAADHPIMIPDTEDERPPKKQKPVMATKIWVRNSRGGLELYSDCDLEALKDELSDYTFLRDVAQMSRHEPQSFDTIECHLADTVPRRQLTFRYDGRRSA